MLAILYPTAWKNVLAGLKAREGGSRGHCRRRGRPRCGARRRWEYNALATAEARVRIYRQGRRRRAIAANIRTRLSRTRRTRRTGRWTSTPPTTRRSPRSTSRRRCWRPTSRKILRRIPPARRPAGPRRAEPGRCRTSAPGSMERLMRASRPGRPSSPRRSLLELANGAAGTETGEMSATGLLEQNPTFAAYLTDPTSARRADRHAGKALPRPGVAAGVQLPGRGEQQGTHPPARPDRPGLRRPARRGATSGRRDRRPALTPTSSSRSASGSASRWAATPSSPVRG